MKRLTRRQSRDVDRIAIEEFGFSGLVLMENAGRGAVDTLWKEKIVKPNFRIGIVCGKGNNGGDGFVMARHFKIRGIDSTIILLTDPAELTGDAKTNFDILAYCDVSIEIFPDLAEKNRSKFRSMLRSFDVLVDAILGTGAVGAPREPFAEAIRSINAVRTETGATVVAVDIPSGLDADSGCPSVPTIVADGTLTFFSEKTGFPETDASKYLGTIFVQDIGVPVDLISLSLSKSPEE